MKSFIVTAKVALAHCHGNAILSENRWCGPFLRDLALNLIPFSGKWKP
jgi:hypothetical protein